MRNFKRVEVFTIDPKGSYYILHMEWWGTLKIVVLEKEWSKLLKANKLEEGYWIQCQESGKIPNSNWFSRWESGKKVTFGDGESGNNVDSSDSSGGEEAVAKLLPTHHLREQDMVFVCEMSVCEMSWYFLDMVFVCHRKFLNQMGLDLFLVLQ